ncbi:MULTISPECIES: GNAT family N-acetyltransferase [Halolamina]|uniref:Acetyltransferase (GNAT) family protein n=1 Tax=Halolamina pelagica TaxID=699431 RepID=A0A1I5RZX5_9EURY|nr:MULTISPECIES: GNAT family N-acetyltransferase [Halolamina]NHX35426.1 GNAT family N-acetyltransferase [Halolamina sp. R1-12]SFP63977.1 Acetyltransferase (GNAT) family protein [Halolamina pelagica]
MDVTTTTEYAADAAIEVREAVPGDYPAVAAFTTDTWESGDYIPEAFPRWMAADDPDTRTFVAVDTTESPPAPESVDGVDPADVDELADGRAVGVCQAVGLSEHEGWMQAMRVDPEYRGRRLSRALNDAGFHWLHETGRRVARNMVFSWNTSGLGASRVNGFEPGTEFRWVQPEPDADATARTDDAAVVDADPDAAWGFWTDAAARDALDGLALDPTESWALSELTRERLRRAAADDRLLVVSAPDGGIGGFSHRVRTSEFEDDGESRTRAEYGVAAWRDRASCDALLAAISRDAASVDADTTRVLIPESVKWVSDTALAGADVGDEPDFVMRADLTERHWA